MVKMFEYKVCRSHRNRKLDLQINSAAKIWNLCIRIHRTYYHLFGKFLSKNELQKILVRLKNKGYFPFLKDIGSQAVQNITDRMDRAYKDWFKNLRNGKKKGRPRKKKIFQYKSFTLKQAGWEINEEEKTIIINKKKYKYHKSRNLDGEIKTVTVKRDACGDFWIYFAVEVEEPVVEVRSGEIVGFDYSFEKDSFLVGQESRFDVLAPSFFRVNLKIFQKLSHALSRKEFGSNNRVRARLSLARQYRKSCWARKDYHYKLAYELCNKYSVICLETLDQSKYARTRHGKKVSDRGFGQFLLILQYVAKKVGTKIVFVDKWFPSSQLCHCCGFQNKALRGKFWIRKWTCPSCGVFHSDRDRNAAINIYNEGLRLPAS